MKFEHLVEINELHNPLTEVITRAQLWRGLVLRAESPQLFVTYIDEANVTERTEVSMARSLRYGELVIVDTVSLVHLEHVHYAVAEQKDIPQSSLRMSIEEPTPDALFVRFAYDDGHSAAEDLANEVYNEYRRSAYQEADIDTVRLIREMAEYGRLNGALS
ncbi:SRPBCC family protein [Undibacterium sp.]|uniref:SRPBCC family protein n=1 Tax=Undibacterium sp. TaxID=1914977 RepID=UPI0025D98851|nr:SRPBCC family protein [Undibacterium sp.]MCX7217625.1 SRPBCC family protein [Burkholderiales bacterium]